MLNSQKIACVIPARLKSSRFPKKMLSVLSGKPLLQWVSEAASSVPCFDSVVFAIDSEEVAAVIRRFGGTFYMTSESLASGTDRLIALMQQKKVDADIWVNWQGDEPFIHQQMIEDLLQTCHEKEGDVWTLKKRLIDPRDIESPHCVKVVVDVKDFALYFSRHCIPYYRDAAKDQRKYFKHIGLYAYRRESLEKISRFTPCEIELAEQLEQLRFLYNGLKVRVHETQYETLGIDLPEHLVQAALLIGTQRS